LGKNQHISQRKENMLLGLLIGPTGIEPVTLQDTSPVNIPYGTILLKILRRK